MFYDPVEYYEVNTDLLIPFAVELFRVNKTS